MREIVLSNSMIKWLSLSSQHLGCQLNIESLGSILIEDEYSVREEYQSINLILENDKSYFPKWDNNDDFLFIVNEHNFTDDFYKKMIGFCVKNLHEYFNYWDEDYFVNFELSKKDNYQLVLNDGYGGLEYIKENGFSHYLIVTLKELLKNRGFQDFIPFLINEIDELVKGNDFKLENKLFFSIMTYHLLSNSVEINNMELYSNQIRKLYLEELLKIENYPENFESLEFFKNISKFTGCLPDSIYEDGKILEVLQKIKDKMPLYSKTIENSLPYGLYTNKHELKIDSVMSLGDKSIKQYKLEIPIKLIESILEPQRFISFLKLIDDRGNKPELVISLSKFLFDDYAVQKMEYLCTAFDKEREVRQYISHHSSINQAVFDKDTNILLDFRVSLDNQSILTEGDKESILKKLSICLEIMKEPSIPIIKLFEVEDAFRCFYLEKIINEDAKNITSIKDKKSLKF